ncbi:helix-turn-helix transcriptional regulator [Flavobacterium sp.]|uniref:S24 family peptidase n=1 Tax=Flavobacterium sp. TaxID=239 RepID=UPI00374DAD73
MGATERVKEYLIFKGISKYKFCQLLGFSNKFLDNSENMGTDKACKILHHFPDINAEWLLTGNGNMVKTDHENDENRTKQKFVTDTKLKDQNIPVYDVRTADEIIDLFLTEENQTSIGYINTPKLVKCDGALYIIGDSMYPLLKNGDIAIYKKVLNHQQNIIWGEMYLICVINDGNESFFIRYLKPSEQEGYVQFISQNTQHPTIEFPITSIKALALVKASIRINSLL